jgi:DNA-binding response OmpR family regulator
MKKIILIEDDIDMNFIISNLLSKNGCKVDSFTTGEGAQNVLSTNHYDIIITDFSLPGMDGFELLELASETNDFSKKIMVSAYGNEKIKKIAAAINVIFVDKPFRNDALLAMVSS